MRIQNMSILKSVAINQIVFCLENEVRDLEKENQMKKYFVPASFAKKKFIHNVSSDLTQKQIFSHFDSRT